MPLPQADVQPGEISPARWLVLDVIQRLLNGICGTLETKVRVAMFIDYALDDAATAMTARSSLRNSHIDCCLELSHFDQVTSSETNRLTFAEADATRALAILRTARGMPR